MMGAGHRSAGAGPPRRNRTTIARSTSYPAKRFTQARRGRSGLGPRISHDRQARIVLDELHAALVDVLGRHDEPRRLLADRPVPGPLDLEHRRARRLRALAHHEVPRRWTAAEFVDPRTDRL